MRMYGSMLNVVTFYDLAKVADSIMCNISVLNIRNFDSRHVIF